MLQVAADSIHGLIGGDLVLVATRLGSDELVVRAASGGYPGSPGVDHHVAIAGTMAATVFATGRAQLSVDATDDPRRDPVVNARFDIGSSLAAPLFQDGEVQGVVTVLSRQKASFGISDLQLLELCCGTAGDRLSHLLRSAGAEALSSTVLDALDEGVFVTRGERLEVLLTNRAFQRMLGSGVHIPNGMMLGDVEWKLFDEDDRPIPPHEFPTVVAGRTGQEVRDAVYRAVHQVAEGYETWFSITALPVLDPLSREVVSVVTRLRDVSADRHAHQQLLKNRERLHAAQELAGLAWWEYDVRADRHAWSEQMFRMVGLDPADEPPNGAGLLALVHPDDRTTADLGGVRRSVGGSVDGSVDPQVRGLPGGPPDGTQRVLQSRSHREYDTDGSLIRIHGATLDVTEREDAVRAIESRDDQLRLAFDGSPIGMSLLDGRPGHEGRLLRVNPALAKLLGTTTRRRLLGRTIEQWTPPTTSRPTPTVCGGSSAARSSGPSTRSATCDATAPGSTRW